MEAAQKSYDEIIDLFARGTTPAQIVVFRPSTAAQKRVQRLLARNKSDALTPEEAGNRGQVLHSNQCSPSRKTLAVSCSPLAQRATSAPP